MKQCWESYVNILPHCQCHESGNKHELLFIIPNGHLTVIKALLASFPFFEKYACQMFSLISNPLPHFFVIMCYRILIWYFHRMQPHECASTQWFRATFTHILIILTWLKKSGGLSTEKPINVSPVINLKKQFPLLRTLLCVSFWSILRWQQDQYIEIIDCNRHDRTLYTYLQPAQDSRATTPRAERSRRCLYSGMYHCPPCVVDGGTLPPDSSTNTSRR